MRAPTGTTLLRAALTGLVMVVLATGCANDPKPATLPSPTATPSSATPSPTPTSPQAQIEAAVRAYYAELTRAAKTNDVSMLRSLSTAACPCYRAVKVIKENARQGERTPDAEFKVLLVRVHDVEGKTAVAEVRTEDAAYDVIHSGKVVDHVDADRTHVDLSMIQQDDGRWVIGNEFNLGAR